MTNRIYTMYNTLSKRYGEVFAAASDAMAEKMKRKQMEQFREELNDYELCRIGKIDIESGEVTPEPAVRIAWSEKAPELPLRNTDEN